MKEVPFRHQLQTTDEQFIEQLKLPGAAGKQLAAAMVAGDTPKAVSIVAAHFRTRSKPTWSYYMHGTAWHETDAPGSVLKKADDLLQDVFINSWAPHQLMNLGSGPDWKNGLSQAGTSIGRNAFVTELSTAYALTGDAKYARKALQLMRSFVDGVPFILDDRFYDDHDAYFGGDGNPTLTVTYRMFRWVDFLYSGAVQAADVLSDADVFWVVKQLWFYSMQFYRFGDDALRRDNHHLVDHGHAPFVMGTIFPEFVAGAELASIGAKIIRYHFGHNLLKDGGYVEHSGEYQYHITYHFLHPHALAAANDVKLFSAADVERLRGWVEFNANACKPNGMLPEIGDSPGRPLAYFFSTLAAPVLTPKLTAMARALGFAAGKAVTGNAAAITEQLEKWKPGTPHQVGLSPYYLERTSTAPVSSKEKAPAQPKDATSHYPLSGYTFFRSDWTPQADYLSFSHFTKHNIGGHAHWDMLSFLLHTRGQTLIGDPAASLYLDSRFYGHTGQPAKPGSEGQGCHRGYSYSVNAHNCLVMNNDFLKPLEAMCHGTFWGGNPPQCEPGIFSAGGAIEVSEAWHDGNAPTRHRRFAVHLPGIGFVIVDKIWRENLDLRPNQYSQYFHFAGDAALSSSTPKPGESVRASLGESTCVIVPGSESHNEWKCFRDAYLDNVFGVANKSGQPWVGELTRRTRGPATFSTFLLTHGADGIDAANLTARHLGGKPSEWWGWQPEGISANALDLGARGTVLVASCPYGKKLESADLSTDADLAVVLLDAAGKVKHWAMARGSSLTVRGKKLASGRAREWAAS